VKKAFEIKDCEVWGGQERQVMAHIADFDVVISLLGSVKRKPLKFTIARGGTRMFSHLTAYQKRHNNVVCIDWPDMSAPELDYEFWEALGQDLGHVNGRAAIFCFGGHGRTGTALCSLILGM
jgi:hypothetical protein